VAPPRASRGFRATGSFSPSTTDSNELEGSALGSGTDVNRAARSRSEPELGRPPVPPEFISHRTGLVRHLWEKPRETILNVVMRTSSPARLQSALLRLEGDALEAAARPLAVFAAVYVASLFFAAALAGAI
jgi:hypothetical protein